MLYSIGLDQDIQNELIVLAKHELAKRPGLRDVPCSSFSSSFRLGSE